MRVIVDKTRECIYRVPDILPAYMKRSLGIGIIIATVALLFPLDTWVHAQTSSTGLDSACVGSIDIPSNIYAGEEFRARIRVRNIGSTTWRRSQDFKLGSPDLQFNLTTWGVGNVPIPVSEGSVPRNDSVRFRFDVTAPVTPGAYTFAWQMLRGSQLFGAVCTRTVDVRLRPNDADSVSITGVPSRVETGQQFTVRITMRNNSRRTWTVGEYRLGSNGLGSSNASVEGPLRAFLHDPVPPNGRATFDLVVTAPSTVTGTSDLLRLRWRMLEENVEWFGDTGSRFIRVYRSANPVVTPTPTLTPTPTVTPTPTPTNPPATATPTPTQSIPNVATRLDCFAPEGTVTPTNNIFRATLSAQQGGVLSGQEIMWATRYQIAVSPVRSNTSAVGSAATTYLIPWDGGFSGTDTVRALFKEVTINGVRYLPSSCSVDFSYSSPALPTPNPNAYDPIVTPTQTPTSTYVPNPYDTQTIAPNPYDGTQTVTPVPVNGYNPENTYISNLSVNITSPTEYSSFTQGTQIPLAVSGNGSLGCGTWTLTKPNGQTVTLTASDFVEGRLPGDISPCTSASDPY